LAVEKLADGKDENGEQRASFHHLFSPHIGRSYIKSEWALHCASETWSIPFKWCRHMNG
jgi:hypothetical protein